MERNSPLRTLGGTLRTQGNSPTLKGDKKEKKIQHIGTIGR